MITDMASFFFEEVTSIHSWDTSLAPSSKVSGIGSGRAFAFDVLIDVCLSSPKEVAGVEDDGCPCSCRLSVVELAVPFLRATGLGSGGAFLRGPARAGLVSPFLGAGGLDASGTASPISSLEAGLD